MPRFTVVVPAVNEERYLPACLSSLAAQDFSGAVQVLVVDNGSTDQTAAVARGFGATVLHEPRPGVCFARQAGTAAARGQIVVSTDADTTFDPGWLSRIDRRFRERPDRVAVAGPCRFVAGPWWGAVYTTVVFGTVLLLQRLTGRVLYASATNIAFRREAWTGYETHLTQGGDELGLLRSLRRAGRLDFDGGNATYTSARRLRRGLAYNLLVTCLFYYVIGYGLNRLMHRRVLGTAPAFREVDPAYQARRRWRAAVPSVAAVVALLLATRLGLALA